MAPSQRRPLIVNLWGMTGVGKTSIVRRFLQLWNNQEGIIHFNMGSKNLIRDLFNAMEHMESLDGQPCVFIFDEFQHAKTQTPAKEVEEPVDRMIWQLMDDGRFSFTNYMSFQSDLREIISGLEICLERGVIIKEGKVLEGWDVFCRVMDEEVGSNLSSNESESEKLPLTRRNIADIHGFAKKEFPYKAQFKNFIFQLDGPELLSYIKRLERKASLSQELDFSKALIVVIGNLDEAYEMSDLISPDFDADILHEASKRITFSQIKEALSSNFRLEEIARLGNIHLIYPSLSSEVFQTFIVRELEEISQRIGDQSCCTFKFTPSVFQMVFEEGVIPSQGLRPLRSSIRYLIESNLLELVQQTWLLEEMVLEVSMDGDDLVLADREKVLARKTLQLPIRQSKRQKMIQGDLAITAVHEAGHVVAFMALRGKMPKNMTITATDHRNGGYMEVEHREVFDTYDRMIREVAVRLAGYKAEEIVFGKENVTNGSTLDIQIATRYLLGAFRAGCFNPKNISFESLPHGTGKFLPESGDSEIWVSERMLEAVALVAKILTNHLPAFKATIQLLLQHHKLTGQQLYGLLTDQGIDVVSMLHNYPSELNYQEKVQQFLQK